MQVRDLSKCLILILSFSSNKDPFFSIIMNVHINMHVVCNCKCESDEKAESVDLLGVVL